jgi:hypothetical protein
LSLEIFLFYIGTFGGIYYFYLGLKASSLQVKTASTQMLDKVLFAAVLWSLDSKVLKAEGKSLCDRGNKVMIFCTLIWVSYGILKYYD